MASKTHNPERRAWRGRSYKKGGARIHELRSARETTKVLGPVSVGTTWVRELTIEQEVATGREVTRSWRWVRTRAAT